MILPNIFRNKNKDKRVWIGIHSKPFRSLRSVKTGQSVKGKTARFRRERIEKEAYID